MENRHEILELAQEMRELVTSCDRYPTRYRQAGELFEAAVKEYGLFHEPKFHQLRLYSDSTKVGGRNPHFVIFFSVTAWISKHPRKFPFDLPGFFSEPGIILNHRLNKYWQTNIPALAEVIEMQCEAELAPGGGQSKEIPREYLRTVGTGGKTRPVFEYLWENGNTSIKDLEKDVWRDEFPERASVKRIISRLGNTLTRHPEIKIESDNEIVYFSVGQK